jgi:MFS family permease
VSASAAAGFAGLLSLFNIAGRIFWASLSDRIGRKPTYAVFFALGMLLYGLVPTAGASGNLLLFVAIFCVVLTMYGGGFATIPAYLADLFGVLHVSAIHGRLLTAWSTAGILGPVLVNYIREYQLERGVAPSDAYTFTMYVLVGLLVIGFVCNIAVAPVARELFTLTAANPAAAPSPSPRRAPAFHAGHWSIVSAAWLLAAVPLAWGVLRTLTLAGQMFR